MTLRPSLLPLRLQLLLLLSGAVCWAEAGFETESPVRTLQVETLVRRKCPGAAGAGPGEGMKGSKQTWERVGEQVWELSWGVGTGSRDRNGPLEDPA